MYLTAAHILFCIIVSGSGLITVDLLFINTVMERGGFSGDFLVTFALSSGTSFSARVWPDVLSSGCVETIVCTGTSLEDITIYSCDVRCTLEGHVSLMDSSWYVTLYIHT